MSPLIAPAPPSARSAPEPSGHESATFGPLVVITGEIKGGEDLTIEGRVEGTIELKQNTLTIGVNATAKADIVAKDIVVLGKVDENVTASSKVEIGPVGTVEGDMATRGFHRRRRDLPRQHRYEEQRSRKHLSTPQVDAVTARPWDAKATPQRLTSRCGRSKF